MFPDGASMGLNWPRYIVSYGLEEYEHDGEKSSVTNYWYHGLAGCGGQAAEPMLAATARLLAERMQRDAEWRHLCVGSMEW